MVGMCGYKYIRPRWVKGTEICYVHQTPGLARAPVDGYYRPWAHRYADITMDGTAESTVGGTTPLPLIFDGLVIRQLINTKLNTKLIQHNSGPIRMEH